MFLTKEELFQLTGYKRRAHIEAWLTQNGFRFVVGGDGWPRVLLAAVERAG
jgi:hypothetical protein